MTEIVTAPTFNARIYIAGDYNIAKQICRGYVMKGLCVNMSKVDYIYTGGEEAGICVELINYPVFQKNFLSILEEAEHLAHELMISLYQKSYTIVTSQKTYYYSRYQDIKEKNKTEERITK